MQFQNFLNQFWKLSVCLGIHKKNLVTSFLSHRKQTGSLALFLRGLLKIILGKNVLCKAQRTKTHVCVMNLLFVPSILNANIHIFCFLNIFCGPIRYSSDLKMDPLISKMSAAIMHASHNLIKIFLKSNIKS